MTAIDKTKQKEIKFAFLFYKQKELYSDDEIYKKISETFNVSIEQLKKILQDSK